MTNPQPRSRCRILSIASPRPATAAQAASATGGPSVGPYPTYTNVPVALLSLIGDQRAINLAELAHVIAADRNLCRRVTEAACREFGRPWLSVEQAIVLLGRERLASQILRFPHTNRTTPAEQLRLPEMLQGKSE